MRRVTGLPLAAAGLLIITGCSKGDKSSKKKGSGAAMSAKGSMSTEAMTARPTKPGVAKAPPGSRAGSKTLLAAWKPEARKLYVKGARLVDQKKHQEAIAQLDQALQKQPGNLDILWERAMAKALAKDPKGALVDLEKVLFGDFPRYAPQVARNLAFEKVRSAPHKAKLDAFVEAARKEHIAAISQAHLFLGSRSRLRMRKKPSDPKKQPVRLAVDCPMPKERYLAGEQGLYGFVPQTGRYVSVAQGAPRGVILGFIRSPDQKIVTYVRVESCATDGGEESYLAYMVSEVVALDLTSLKPLDVRYGYESDAKKYYGGKSCEPHMDQRVSVALHQSGVWQLLFKTYACAADVVESTVKWKRYPLKYAVGQKPVKVKRPDKKDPKVASFAINICRYNAGQIKGRRARPKKPLKLGDAEIALPCKGRVWASPDAKRVAFRPGRKCKKDGKPMTGLWLWTAAAKAWTQLTTEAGVKQVRWLRGGPIMAQIKRRVLFLDPAKKKQTWIAAPAAYLRAYVPRIERCGIKMGGE